LILAPAKFYTPTGWGHGYGPLFPAITVFGAYLLICHCYIFSDGVYEVEKSDGSMWQFKEFEDFLNKIKSGSQSRLDRLYQHAENINKLDNFSDDFTILEVAFR
jgi:serine phosphatase RsbU (regulator of sigma subunit)